MNCNRFHKYDGYFEKKTYFIQENFGMFMQMGYGQDCLSTMARMHDICYLQDIFSIKK